MAVSSIVVRRLGYEQVDQAVVFMLAQPTRWKVALAVTAGITEEIMFRGYVIERTLELTGSAPLAGALSVVVFTAAHLPGRRVQVVLSEVLGAAIGLVIAYFLFRNVLVLAVIHASIDLIVLVTNEPTDTLEQVDTSNLNERVLKRIDESRWP